MAAILCFVLLVGVLIGMFIRGALAWACDAVLGRWL